MLLSKSAVCHSKKSRFVKELKAIGLLSSLGIKKLKQSFISKSSFALKVMTS